jgi:hypothetical protein
MTISTGVRLAALALAGMLPACGGGDGTTQAPATTAPPLEGEMLLMEGTSHIEITGDATASADLDLTETGEGLDYRSRYSTGEEFCIAFRSVDAGIGWDLTNHPEGCAPAFEGEHATGEDMVVTVGTDEPDFLFMSEEGECTVNITRVDSAGLEGTLDCTDIQASGLFGSLAEGAVDVHATFTAGPGDTD